MNLSILVNQPRTILMGILNVTPDSFSDGGNYLSPEKAVARAHEMLLEGADIIDIGGESTRPGSEAVSAEEEVQRVLPVIQALKKELGDSITVSVDTNKSAVAREALKVGADLINSLGGFTFDHELIAVCKEYNTPIVLYHIKGEPRTMQQGEIVYQDVIVEIASFFTAQIEQGVKAGMRREQFILDPGIGFGKSLEHNLTIIKHLDEFKKFDLPLMIGVSRKSHLGLLLQQELALPTLPSPVERLEAALAETAVAVRNGATIVRTHDVLSTKRFLTVFNKL